MRKLRLREGMTQQDPAALMGRQGKGNHQLLGRVELGKAPYPSLGACRASFSDIADLLNACTMQPTVVEQRGYKRVRSLTGKLPASGAKAVERYDHHVTRAKRKPEPVRRRLAPARAYAQAQEKQRQLSRLVEAEIASAHLGSVSPEAVWPRVYARKLWRVLGRTSSADSDRLKRRLKLEELERWTAEVGIESLPVRALLRDRITALVDERTTRT
ncbi:hypothetical protein JXD38_08855 [candidate division WOR-3 bacterium]|nr:hypothetical protein [candidate division WOR-3 bacterium]